MLSSHQGDSDLLWMFFCFVLFFHLEVCNIHHHVSPGCSYQLCLQHLSLCIHFGLKLMLPFTHLTLAECISLYKIMFNI